MDLLIFFLSFFSLFSVEEFLGIDPLEYLENGKFIIHKCLLQSDFLRLLRTFKVSVVSIQETLAISIMLIDSVGWDEGRKVTPNIWEGISTCKGRRTACLSYFLLGWFGKTYRVHLYALCSFPVS